MENKKTDATVEETVEKTAKKQTNADLITEFTSGLNAKSKVEENCLIVEIVDAAKESDEKVKGTLFQRTMSDKLDIPVEKLDEYDRLSTNYGKAVVAVVGEEVNVGYGKHKEVDSFMSTSDFRGGGSLKLTGDKIVEGTAAGKPYKTTGLTIKESAASLGGVYVKNLKEKINKTIGNL